mmetsp:Transcript_3028/g.7398  ORF Transcript_3028/g.7398 Transcript_3028/m.7398 type:complete len:236 (-) Transcript_3028:787-1494(-)
MRGAFGEFKLCASGVQCRNDAPDSVCGAMMRHLATDVHKHLTSARHTATNKEVEWRLLLCSHRTGRHGGGAGGVQREFNPRGSCSGGLHLIADEVRRHNLRLHLVAPLQPLLFGQRHVCPSNRSVGLCLCRAPPTCQCHRNDCLPHLRIVLHQGVEMTLGQHGQLAVCSSSHCFRPLAVREERCLAKVRPREQRCDCAASFEGDDLDFALEDKVHARRDFVLHVNDIPLQKSLRK